MEIRQPLVLFNSRKKVMHKEKKEQKVHRKVTQCNEVSDLPVQGLQPLLGVEFLWHIHSWRRDHIIALNSVTGPIPFLIINLQAHHHRYPVSLPEHVCHINSPTGRSDIPIWTLTGSHMAPRSQGHPARTHQLKPKTLFFLTSISSLWTLVSSASIVLLLCY